LIFIKDKQLVRYLFMARHGQIERLFMVIGILLGKRPHVAFN
jgi:hypothetical protein